MNLIPERPGLLERRSIGDIVNKDKGVRRRDRQGPHSRKLVSTRRVQNVQREMHPRHVELPVVHLLHRPLVLGRERPVQELADNGRLPHLGRPHHHYLVADVAVAGAADVVVLLGVGVLAPLGPEDSSITSNAA